MAKSRYLGKQASRNPHNRTNIFQCHNDGFLREMYPWDNQPDQSTTLPDWTQEWRRKGKQF